MQLIKFCGSDPRNERKLLKANTVCVKKSQNLRIKEENEESCKLYIYVSNELKISYGKQKQ